jgi:hypothetical protein
MDELFYNFSACDMVGLVPKLALWSRVSYIHVATLFLDALHLQPQNRFRHSLTFFLFLLGLLMDANPGIFILRKRGETTTSSDTMNLAADFIESVQPSIHPAFALTAEFGSEDDSRIGIQNNAPTLFRAPQGLLQYGLIPWT